MPIYFFFLGLSGENMTTQTFISSTVWILVVAVVAWALVRPRMGTTNSRDTSGPTDQRSERDALLARYVRGEIDAETFRKKMARLKAANEADNTGDTEDTDDTSDDADAPSEQSKSASRMSTPWSRTPPGIPPGLF
ncbi:MAG TPA: hypothetical protein VFU63_07005 [Ktedonobacterales bacterium]|nr:hypothetical protein [Ktedonobacterales bacterium]